MSELRGIVESVKTACKRMAGSRSLLVAISGIDAAGKGYFASRLVEALRAQGLNAVTINIDGWLNLPDRRFRSVDAGEHFYHHAIRFEELFQQLVLPLRNTRSVSLLAEFAHETATNYAPHFYSFENVDVIVLEGIFLLKSEFRAHYDVSIWIECGFETALARAIARAQEGLAPQETARAYRQIYFPAQEVHFRRDDPRAAVAHTVINDPLLGPVTWTK
jgi:uridine kinase